MPDNSSSYFRDQESMSLLRERLQWLRARYDHGAISPAVYSAIKSLEVELAWREHGQVRS